MADLTRPIKPRVVVTAATLVWPENSIYLKQSTFQLKDEPRGEAGITGTK